MKLGTTARMILVLSAAGFVVAVTWVRFTPYDAARDLRAQAVAAKGQAPAPGAEALLRRSVLAPPHNEPRPGTDVTHLGPLRSIAYLGSLKTIPLPGLGRRIDNFWAIYQNGMLVWRVSPSKDGAPPIVVYVNPEPMKPQQVIELYNIPPPVPWMVPMAVQLLVLLMFALIGRKVLRIRL